MNYILSNLKIKYCTKEIYRIIKYVLLVLLIVLTIIAIKYKPVFEVYINGESIGYVKSKTDMENIINNKVLVSNNPCAVFTTLNVDPVYELKFVTNDNAVDEDELAEALLNQTTTMYKVYAITLNNEVKSYVNSWDEAQKIVDEMKTEYADSIDVNISVNEKYTENIDELKVTELADAESDINSQLRIIKTEQEKIASATCNGVYFSVKPVTGSITSRYGAVESIRDHTHMGLDIAASAGTPIKAAAAGTVSYSGWMSGYGYLVIIDHDNGVQTCYGHCSKLYVSEGDKVEAGDKIAAVGSTGDSTGNHLHFEVRVNGEKVNPQNYLYK